MFGSKLQGDVLQRDVKQTNVTFTGHKFLSPAHSYPEIMQELKRILFENVIEYLKGLLSRKRHAETEQLKDDGNMTAKVQNLNNPSEYLDTLVALLELPLDLIRMHQSSIRINKMGMKLPSDQESDGEDIHLQQVEIGEEYTSLIMITEIPWASLKGNT